MLRFEKILLLLLAALTFLPLLWGHTGGVTLIPLVLAAVYAGGSYWLFRSPTGAAAGWVRILTGLVLAGALLQMGNSIRLRHGRYEQAAPVLVGLLSLGLGATVLVQRRHPARVATYTPLLLRAGVVFSVCSFFAYCPVTVPLTNAVLRGLNADKPWLVRNLRMHDYAQRTEDAWEAQDGTTALAYARQAYAVGHVWLGEDSVTDRRSISGVYTNLYKAYRLQGDTAYARGQYRRALDHYQRGHQVLLRGDYRTAGQVAPSLYWQKEPAWSLNNMALCYGKLQELGPSDSLLVAALTLYRRVQPVPDVGLSRLLRDLGASQAAGYHWPEAMLCYRQANRILKKIPTAEARQDLLSNQFTLVRIYLSRDSLASAQRLLASLRYPRADSTSWFMARLYTGACLYRQSRYGPADQHLRPVQRYLQRHAAQRWVSLITCELLRAQVSLAQANYAEATTRVGVAQRWVSQKLGPRAPQANQCRELLAALAQAQGHYAPARALYQQVLTSYAPGEQNDPAVAAVLAQLAELDVTLGDIATARTRIAEALTRALGPDTLRFPNQTGVVLTAAYVNYVAGRPAAARAQYRRILRVNTRFGQARSISTAAAWNGLGLLATEQQRLPQADSLFAAALALQQALVGDQHPTTAVVYLNHGLLRARQGRLAEADAFLDQADRIAQARLPADHDLFGDLLAGRGDVALRQGNRGAAHCFYQRALAVYVHKFAASHWKVQRMTRQLGRTAPTRDSPPLPVS